jgi:hypothetical protein
MTVAELREALAHVPGHWPVHVAVRSDGSGDGADEDFLYTLECKAEVFPAHGNIAVVRAHYEPS